MRLKFIKLNKSADIPMQQKRNNAITQNQRVVTRTNLKKFTPLMEHIVTFSQSSLYFLNMSATLH